MEPVKKVDVSVVAKAGLWYTVCNFIFRGLAFLTMPLFTRIMPKAGIGYIGNFSSWVSILIVLTSFDLSQSIIRSKLEVGDDMDSYIWSILSFSTIATLVAYGVFCLFPGFFSELLKIEQRHFHIMFLYLLAVPAYQMLITKQRAYYKYKTFVLLTGISSVAATVFSVCFVLLFEDKVTGRLLGHYLPFILMGAVIYVILVRKGRTIKLQYWKYAIALCFPLVPHVLSLHLLSSSDKIIITRLCGEEYTAVYTVANSCYHITVIFFQSLNRAWAPWLLDNLHIKNYSEIRSVSKKYVAAFLAIIIAVLLVAPEIILILGGKPYADAVYCIPPLIASCLVQLIYTMYVNIEFYEKKTIGVSIATLIAAGINILLNFLIIPMFPERGYAVAAYTTLAGYLVLFAIHYYLVRRMGMGHVFDIRFLLLIIVGTIGISVAVNFLYQVRLLRYLITLAYGTAIVILLIKNRELIRRLLKRK